MAPIDSPLTLCLALLACWALVGAGGLLRPNSVALVGRVLFPLGAIIGVCLAIVAAISPNQPVERPPPPIGLPDLSPHVRPDNLSRGFLVLLPLRASLRVRRRGARCPGC